MADLKVEGKVADFCPKCKNCKSTTRECDGTKDWITEIECEDPYDGMIRTLDADSDICCSMFETRPDRACESEDSRIEEIREGLMKITKTFTNEELIKASKRKDELIQNYREKSKNYEQILNNILNEVYEHPRLFERNMTAYELLPGRVKFLKDSWDIMCDKYDPLNIENEQRKKAMDNQAKMIQERDELIQSYREELRNADEQFKELTRRYNMIAKKLNDIHDILKEDPNNE